MLVGPGVGKKPILKKEGRKYNLNTRKGRGWGGFGAASDHTIMSIDQLLTQLGITREGYS